MGLKEKSNPDQLRWQREFSRSIAASIHCTRIGRVEHFDPKDQTASVQLMQKGYDPATGKEFSYPLLTNCPVFVLTGGTASVQMPIQKGDFCIVLFSDRMLDDWWASGEEKKPSFWRLHDLSDGIALVGIRPLSSPIEDYSPDGVRVRADKVEVAAKSIELGNADEGKVKVTAKSIELGKGASKGVAREGDTVTITLADLAKKLTAPSGGGVVVATKPITCKITSASDKVKAS